MIGSQTYTKTPKLISKFKGVDNCRACIKNSLNGLSEDEVYCFKRCVSENEVQKK